MAQTAEVNHPDPDVGAGFASRADGAVVPRLLGCSEADLVSLEVACRANETIELVVFFLTTLREAGSRLGLAKHDYPVGDGSEIEFWRVLLLPRAHDLEIGRVRKRAPAPAAQFFEGEDWGSPVQLERLADRVVQVVEPHGLRDRELPRLQFQQIQVRTTLIAGTLAKVIERVPSLPVAAFASLTA